MSPTNSSSSSSSGAFPDASPIGCSAFGRFSIPSLIGLSPSVISLAVAFCDSVISFAVAFCDSVIGL